MMRIFIFLLLAALPFVSFSQITEGVKWKISIEPQSSTYEVGQKIFLVAEADIKKGFHIFCSEPSDAYKHTECVLDKTAKGIKISGKIQDIGVLHKEYDELMGGDMKYYENKVTFKVPIVITSESIVLEGFMDYQICDTVACLPGKQDFSFKFKAIKKKTDINSDTTHTDTSLNNFPSSENNHTDNKTPQTTATEISTTNTNTAANDKGSSLFSIFWVAFLGGLAALMTPCVFPMIPMTVSFFTKKSIDKATGIKNALVYSSSIIFIYVVLGLLVTALLGPEVLASMASNPWVNLFFFALVIIFGFSFLGWFEITLPSNWLTAIDSKKDAAMGAKKNQINFSGIFFMALTLVLVSFSCTGPIVGSLLVSFSTGSFLGPVVGMTGYSLAFALPFSFFAMFPGYLQSLPKSGGWLNSVKVVLGFLELALAFKFLSSADLVMHWGILDREIFLGIWIVLFSLMGFYLLGWLQLPHDSKIEYISVPRLLLAVTTFWFVLYMIPGLWGAPLKFLSGLLPPMNKDIGVQVIGGVPTFSQSTENLLPPNRKYANRLENHTPIDFHAFYDLDEALAYSEKIKKPVFIDFTGIQCTNCRQMEANVWTDPLIKRTIQENFVMVQLFGDDREALPEVIVTSNGKKLRTLGDKWQNFVIETYKTNAMPYYAIVDSKMKDLAPPRPYNLDKEAYLAFLNQGIKNYK